jgi:hypothetical protein
VVVENEEQSKKNNKNNKQIPPGKEIKPVFKKIAHQDSQKKQRRNVKYLVNNKVAYTPINISIFF